MNVETSIGSDKSSLASSNASQASMDQWAKLSGEQDLVSFMSAWLELTCTASPDLNRGVAFFATDANEAPKPVARWATVDASLDVKGFALIAQNLLLKSSETGQGTLEQTKEDGTFAAYPFLLDGHAIGGVVVAGRVQTQNSARRLLRHLQWSQGWVEAFLRRTQSRDDADITKKARSVLDMVAIVAPRPDFRDACRVFADALSQDLGAQRVSIGFAHKTTHRVIAIAQSANFDRAMKLGRVIEETMDEAADQDSALLVSSTETDETVNAAALQRLAREGGAKSVLTIPLPSEGGTIGGITLERMNDTPYSQDDIYLADALAAAITPLLLDKRERSRSLFSHIGQRMKSFFGWLVGPRALVWKIAFLVLISAIVASILFKTEHRISADSTVEGEIRRVVTAPTDGFVRAALVRAGAIVKEGDVLAELDDSDLQLDRLRLAAQRQQHLLELNRAQGERDLAGTNILRAQLAQDDAEITLVLDMLRRSQIEAPFDGVVVAGDLSQSVGQPVTRGDTLFELAPLDTYRIISLVPEGDIELLKSGTKGQLLLSALPETTFDYVIDTVTPIARADEGINGFEVIGILEDPTGRIRPRMEGVARLSVGTRSYASIWTRSLVQWARIKLWAVWP